MSNQNSIIVEVVERGNDINLKLIENSLVRLSSDEIDLASKGDKTCISKATSEIGSEPNRACINILRDITRAKGDLDKSTDNVQEFFGGAILQLAKPFVAKTVLPATKTLLGHMGSAVASMVPWIGMDVIRSSMYSEDPPEPPPSSWGVNKESIAIGVGCSMGVILLYKFVSWLYSKKDKEKQKEESFNCVLNDIQKYQLFESKLLEAKMSTSIIMKNVDRAKDILEIMRREELSEGIVDNFSRWVRRNLTLRNAIISIAMVVVVVSGYLTYNQYNK